MSLVAVSFLLHHPAEALTVLRDGSLAREELDAARLPAALGLDADVLHDGGALFGVERPLIHLEARRAELP